MACSGCTFAFSKISLKCSVLDGLFQSEWSMTSLFDKHSVIFKCWPEQSDLLYESFVN